MNKLKPILAYHFWILYGAALLLPLFGWWWAGSALTEAADKREKVLKQAFADVHSSRALNAPNTEWTEQATAVNDELDASLALKTAELWFEQRKRAVWSPALQGVMRNVTYRGRLESRETPLVFRDNYDAQFFRIVSIVDPYRNGRGKVLVEQGAIEKTDVGKWQIVPPTWRQMWDNQEDLWLLTDVLEAIRDVNAGANSISEARVRQISGLSLSGGDLGRAQASMRPPARSSRRGGSNSPGGGGRTAAPAYVGPGGYQDTSHLRGGSFGAGGGRQHAGVTAGVIAFSDEDVFGPAKSAGRRGRVGQNTPAAKRRYIADRKSLPYRTRGFRLTVVIRQEALPELLEQLTNGAWPTEIVRIHQAEFKSETVTGWSMGAGGFQGGGYSGAGFQAGGYNSFSTRRGSYGANRGSQARRQRPKERAIPKDRAQASLTDKFLVQVSIAGIKTLYNRPEELPNVVADQLAEYLAAPVKTPANSVVPTDEDSDNLELLDDPESDSTVAHSGEDTDEVAQMEEVDSSVLDETPAAMNVETQSTDEETLLEDELSRADEDGDEANRF